MFKTITVIGLLLCLMYTNAIFAVEGVLLGTPDPAVIQHTENSYYIFATGKGLPIYHSTDLVNWNPVGTVFDKPVPAWSKQAVPETQGIWAPDIVKLNDKYYVYYCASSFGSQRSVIGVATNTTLDHTSPDYKWIDQGLVIESFPNKCDFNAIDPAAFQQDDGRAFMVWGSFWGGIKCIELNPETGKPLSDEPDIIAIASRPKQRLNAIEGAYMVKRNGMYYMFVSWDVCCEGAESTYKVMVGRSENPLGPYVDFTGKPLLEGGGTLVLSNNDNWRGPGHNSVLTTEKGSWLVHHTYDTFNLEKQRILQIRPIYWTESGWPVAGEPLGPNNPMTTERPVVSTKDLIGSWRLSQNYGPETIIDLLPGGRIANHKGAWWKIAGSQLQLFVPNGSSPDTARAVECFIEMAKHSFIGRDSSGVVIRGKQLQQ